MSGLTIRIATRKSELALWQANHVADLLRALPDVMSVELVPMVTKGDQILDRALNKVGGKGLFIKELERAMLDGEADIAVHSMKDVPAEMPTGFKIAAVLERADPRDALVGSTLEDLPRGARVGTSSLRRQSQLLDIRPDLDIQPLRGNVNTRLAKLDAGDYDAIVLATAGLDRLGMADRISDHLSVATMLPAVGQGIVGIECRDDQPQLAAVLAALNSSESERVIAAERAVALHLEASCHSPLGVHATLDAGAIALRAVLASADGRKTLREQATGGQDAPVELGARVARALLERGGRDLIVPDPE
jgi:hydroxymethylbilane synthase